MKMKGKKLRYHERKTDQIETAYFTAEAAFILPIAFGALLFMVYLSLYQYDRCLLEQDMGSLVLWGSVVPVKSAEEWKKQVEYKAAAIYQDKYFAWKTTDIQMELKRNHVMVKGKGILCFPLPGWNIWNQENTWSAETEYRNERLSPVFFIRQYYKLKGETE